MELAPVLRPMDRPPMDELEEDEYVHVEVEDDARGVGPHRPWHARGGRVGAVRTGAARDGACNQRVSVSWRL